MPEKQFSIPNARYVVDNNRVSLYNKNMQKTLVFGGAFDPPHLEHANVCKHALKQLGISKLVLVPTFSPPHKSAGFLDFDERCELLKIAFDGFDFDL